MAGELNFGGMGLGREDEIFARIVVDLGLAKSGDVMKAVNLVGSSKLAGKTKSLAEALQELGSLHPRFVSVVMKAVNAQLSKVPGQKSAKATGDAGAATRRAAREPPRPARGEEELQKEPSGGGAAPGQAPGIEVPSAATYKQAPKGEGFSRRSKTEVASAWAAHRKGQGAPAPEEAPAPPPQPGPARANPLAALVGPRKPEKADVPPRQPVTLGIGISPGALEKPRKKQKKPQKAGEDVQPPKRLYKRQKYRSTGATQHIDVSALREELGIDSRAKSGAASRADAGPADEKQKEVAMRAFIRRAIRSTLHQQCLDIVLRRRLTVVSAARLAEEATCREKNARRVLEDWKEAGLMVQESTGYDLQYRFSPGRADLATVREFMILWNESEWHNRLLGWIIEEESG